jgi:hypothetical protein
MAWPPHSLAGEPIPELDLRLREAVVSVVDLPGVPIGTKGRVEVADGFAWRRYTVRFENGVYVDFLDGRHIESAGRRRGLRRR